MATSSRSSSSSSSTSRPERSAFKKLDTLSPAIEPMAHVWLRAVKPLGGLLPCHGKLGRVDYVIVHVL
jgi:hypothetical protein